MEVLEAVHLLLFFPLFVVVVAVDPRWLRHSLTGHYPATLNPAGRIVLLDGRAGTSLYSTPQDYLEKIFQIPFALRPVEKGGYQSLVADLVRPLPPRKRRAKAPAVPAGDGGAPQAPTGGDGRAAEGQQAGATLSPPPPGPGPGEAAEETSAETPYTPIPPRQLEFTEWEKTDIQRLWPMFRTPRTVKRFINVYRLVRAGLASDEDVSAFTGALDSPGHYQVALLLLAAVTAFPNEAERFLYRLDEWLDQDTVKAQGQRRWSWADVVQFLQTEHEAGNDKQATSERARHAAKGHGTGARAGARKSAGAARGRLAQTRQNRQNDRNGGESLPAEDGEEAETSWALLLDCLDRITGEDTWESFEAGTLRTWAARAARFSFSVHPANVLESLGQ